MFRWEKVICKEKEGRREKGRKRERKRRRGKELIFFFK